MECYAFCLPSHKIDRHRLVLWGPERGYVGEIWPRFGTALDAAVRAVAASELPPGTEVEIIENPASDPRTSAAPYFVGEDTTPPVSDQPTTSECVDCAHRHVCAVAAANRVLGTQAVVSGCQMYLKAHAN